MSRWQEVRKEYRRLRSDGFAGQAMAEAQRVVRASHGRPESVGHGLGFTCARYDPCVCTGSTLDTPITYDDWGDGPQCTKCGKLKEVEDEQ